jgi:hypothetical protein
MHLCLSIAFTLLAAVAGMYLLAKTKAEALGKFFKFISWCVIIVAGISLLCQLGWIACRMVCCTGICPPSENCMPDMMIQKHSQMNGMHGECSMHQGCCEMPDCRSGREECSSSRCCDEMKESHGKCCDEMREGEDGCDHGKKDHMEAKEDSAKPGK